MSIRINTDITIVGGGIAGLWLLNTLRNKGYQAILLEKERLGSCQTNASQGMIHGGIKYTLGGFLTNSSQQIADMPAYWHRCLHGEGKLDLRDVNVLSDHYYMWSTTSFSSRLTAFLGSKAVRGRTEKLRASQLPAAFSDVRFKGTVYRLNDLVLDVHSLINSLYQRQRDWVFKLDPSIPGSLTLNQDGSLAGIVSEGGVCIKAKRYIFAAGAGNEKLIHACGIEPQLMQRRPLHQVLVKHNYPHPIYAHCIDLKSGSTPRLTVTSHPFSEGTHVWSLGGALAESGVSRDENEQIAFAKSELAATLPWIELENAEWKTVRIDRAEPTQSEHTRPDRHYVKSALNILVVWPVKLTLAPGLADEVEAILDDQKIKPVPERNDEMAVRSLPKASPVIPLWQSLFT
jgi:glycerol-3-phosphate dehydrogenase